jgi:hypothetical protein
MPTQEIGALIVSLRTESAEFQAEMDRARKSMKGAGSVANESSRQIAKLAADGFGAVLPISFKVENAIERFIEKALRAESAISLLGKAALVLGAGFAAFNLGKMIGEWLALGESVEAYEKRIKEATEEQEKFLAVVARESDLLRGLKRQLAQSRGDELAVLRFDQEDRDAGIRKTFKVSDPRRDEALAASNQFRLQEEAKFFAKQRELRDDNEKKTIEALKREREEQVKTWESETAFLVGELKKRADARKTFEERLGEGGLGRASSVAGGLAEVLKIRKEFSKELQDLAFLQREGGISSTDATQEQQRILQQLVKRIDEARAKFGNLPPVLDAIDSSLEPLHINFVAIGREMETARAEIDRLVPTFASLQGGLGTIAGQLAAMPSFTDPASQAVRTVSRDFDELRASVDAARIALQLYNQVAAGS